MTAMSKRNLMILLVVLCILLVGTAGIVAYVLTHRPQETPPIPINIRKMFANDAVFTVGTAHATSCKGSAPNISIYTIDAGEYDSFVDENMEHSPYLADRFDGANGPTYIFFRDGNYFMAETNTEGHTLTCVAIQSSLYLPAYNALLYFPFFDSMDLHADSRTLNEQVTLRLTDLSELQNSERYTSFEDYANLYTKLDASVCVIDEGAQTVRLKAFDKAGEKSAWLLLDFSTPGTVVFSQATAPVNSENPD